VFINTDLKNRFLLNTTWIKDVGDSILPNGFQIVCPNVTYSLGAETNTQKQEWIQLVGDTVDEWLKRTPDQTEKRNKVTLYQQIYWVAVDDTTEKLKDKDNEEGPLSEHIGTVFGKYKKAKLVENVNKLGNMIGEGFKSITHIGTPSKRDRANSLSDLPKDADTRISVPNEDLIALDDNFALFANRKIEHTKTDATTIDQLLSLEIDDPLHTLPSPRGNNHSQDTSNSNNQTRSNSHNNVHLQPPIVPIPSTSPPISPRKPNNMNINILTPTIATIPPSPTATTTTNNNNSNNSNNNLNSNNLGSVKLTSKKVGNSSNTDLPSLANPPPVPPRVRPVSSINVGNGILTPPSSPLATTQVGNSAETIKPLASPSESKKEKKKPSNPFYMLDNE